MKVGSCVIIDCHSFPSRPRRYELDKSEHRPDICLGINSFHTPIALEDLVKRSFVGEGYRIQVDSPYTGSIVPNEHYTSEPHVASIMVELNRRLYMDEESANRLPGFSTHRDTVSRALTAIRHSLELTQL